MYIVLALLAMIFHIKASFEDPGIIPRIVSILLAGAGINRLEKDPRDAANQRRDTVQGTEKSGIRLLLQY